MEDKRTLHIPMGIKEKNEFWEGFGGKELKRALTIIFIAVIIDIIVYSITKSLVFFMVFILTSIGTSIMISTKGEINLSVIDQIINMKTFFLSQKFYPYKSLDEWK